MAKYKVVITGIDTSRLPVLKSKETEELLREYSQNRDENIINRIVEGNLKLVLSVVKKFSDRYDNMDDLFQIGTIGLIKAARNFSLDHNVRFSTYAVPMIIGEIKRFLRDNTHLRVSRQIKDLAYKALKVKEEFQRQHYSEPSNKELADLLQVSEFQLKEALDSIQQVSSLSDPIFTDDGDSFSYFDQLADESNDLSTTISNKLTLRKGMDLLNATQRKIIRDRYYEDKTQLEIANEFGISQAQVSRIEKNAIKILRNLF